MVYPHLRAVFTWASLSLIACVSSVGSVGCNKDSGGTGNTGASEESTANVDTSATMGAGTTGTSGATATPTTTTDATSDDSTPTTSGSGVSETFPDGDIPSGGQCSLFSQDCSASEKCNAWSMDGGIFPDGAKCVPIMGDAQVGEGCTVEGKFGDGIDNCVEGSICLDLDNSGKATCVAYCQGSMGDPTCPGASDECAFLFDPTVPLCFPGCDPLTQNCGQTDTCVPNIAALGAEFFVCMPRVFEQIPGQYGDACYALSGCDPSYLCIFAENVPGCGGEYCCSTYCDLSTPDTCTQFDPTLSCVPWFTEGQATPGYEDLGICGVMP